MPTIAQQLSQLETDRQDLVDNLETKGITGLTGDETFTELVPEVLNIPAGGVSIDDYFEVEPDSISSTSSNPWAQNNYIKQCPNITIPNNTTNLNYLFAYWGLKEVPKIIAGNNITNMNSMFAECKAIDIDFSGLDFSNVSQASNFLASSYVHNVNLSNINFSKLTYISGMFGSTVASRFPVSGNNYTLNLENSTFSELTNLGDAFNGSQRHYVNLKNTTFSKVTSVGQMFNASGYNTSGSEIEIDFTGASFPLLTSMYRMFYQINAQGITIKGLDTSNITNFKELFYNSNGRTTFSINNFNTRKVTNMQRCFYGISQYNSSNVNLDLSSWETPVLTNTQEMFYNCTHLSQIDMRNFDFTNVNTYTNMFGASASNGVPDNCEIIVKNSDAKTWIQTNFARLTNVKTVAELS